MPIVRYYCYFFLLSLSFFVETLAQLYIFSPDYWLEPNGFDKLESGLQKKKRRKKNKNGASFGNRQPFEALKKHSMSGDKFKRPVAMHKWMNGRV